MKNDHVSLPPADKACLQKLAAKGSLAARIHADSILSSSIRPYDF